MEDHFNWQGNRRLFENPLFTFKFPINRQICLFLCISWFVCDDCLQATTEDLKLWRKEKEWRKFWVLVVLAYYVKLLITSSEICYFHVYPWPETLSRDNIPNACPVLYYIPVTPVFVTKWWFLWQHNELTVTLTMFVLMDKILFHFAHWIK
jgi:hypothetical protein